MKTKPTFELSKVFRALAFAMPAAVLMYGASAVAAEADEVKTAEEVAGNAELITVTARLKSAASDVVEERREQAYVADLMGADQISRTGDSDAAGALRRVTGLTLKDGKFIYVRGLGERYSSTSLNGAMVPTPDPTRSVIPLDLFPAAIIESLSVQKAASASKPAAFGGGHVDIRTKSIPQDQIFKVSLSGKYNTNNDDDGFDYKDGDDDWYGRDDGTRELPSQVINAYNDFGGVSVSELVAAGLTPEQAKLTNQQLGASMNRDLKIKDNEDLPFGFSGGVAYGNSYDATFISDEAIFGFVASGYYKNEAENYDYKDREYRPDGGIENSNDVVGTEWTVQWSGMFNMGLEINEDHTLETRTTLLQDTVDDVSIRLNETNDTIDNPDRALQYHEIDYEERTLLSNQVSGEHFFPQWFDTEFSWQYTDAKAKSFAPNNVEQRYFLSGANLDTRALDPNDGLSYHFSRLDDETESYDWALALPFIVGDAELKLTGGYSYFERSRKSFTNRLSFDISGTAIDRTGDIDEIFSDENVLSANSPIELKTNDAGSDDYVAAQKLDAGFFEFDLNYDYQLRISGGVRYEDFRQAVVTLDQDGHFDDDRYNVEDAAFTEDNWYPSLSVTWMMNDDMQLRAGYSKTVIRPDLREVAPVRFDDPVTGFEMLGNPDLDSSDINNLDVRWEWYMESGSNLSVGAFYKDLDAPIESVQVNTEQGNLFSFQNADSGEVYGVELEALRDFSFINSDAAIFEGMFVAGNLTLSDSEIEISPQSNINPTNLSRRMTGHSEWVANVQLSFDSPDAYHSATLVYNVFGERIAFAGEGGNKDIYEQPFHSLDATYSFLPTDSMAIKLKLKNLLGSEVEYEQGGRTTYKEDPGSEITLSFSYEY